LLRIEEVLSTLPPSPKLSFRSPFPFCTILLFQNANKLGADDTHNFRIGRSHLPLLFLVLRALMLVDFGAECALDSPHRPLSRRVRVRGLRF
jgi:hypothetical protein